MARKLKCINDPPAIRDWTDAMMCVFKIHEVIAGNNDLNKPRQIRNRRLDFCKLKSINVLPINKDLKATKGTRAKMKLQVSSRARHKLCRLKNDPGTMDLDEGTIAGMKEPATLLETNSGAGVVYRNINSETTRMMPPLVELESCYDEHSNVSTRKEDGDASKLDKDKEYYMEITEHGAEKRHEMEDAKEYLELAILKRLKAKGTDINYWLEVDRDKERLSRMMRWIENDLGFEKGDLNKVEQWIADMVKLICTKMLLNELQNN